ncbi:MAG: hypothetical protein WA828_06125 [Coleofasciculaceae cyanobacterium]
MPAPLKKLVLTPVLVSAAVFATLTLPLAFFGKKPVTIQLQEEPIFSGQLRDIAAPYLGLASILSLGAGFASVAITGWRSSTHKSSQVEAQLSNLTENLREKEAQLEALKLSESQLEAAGLSAFLDEAPQQQLTQSPVVANVEAPQQLTQPPVVANVEAPQQLTQPPVVANVEPAPIEALVITAQPFAAPQNVPSAHSSRTVQVVSGFANAQPFLGYARMRAKIVPQPAPITQAPLDVSLDVRELHTKLEQIRSQMATLQNAIASTSSSSIETQPSRQTPAEITAATHLQVVNWSVNQKSS